MEKKVDQKEKLPSPDREKNVSQQLLYSEKFKDTYEEEKLKVVGKDSIAAVTKGPGKTFTVPESSVMSKARDFISMMSQSNSALSARLAENPEEKIRLDMGLVDSEQPHVEMDLMFVPQEAAGESDSDQDSSDEEEDVKRCLDILTNGTTECTGNAKEKDSDLIKLKLPKRKQANISQNKAIEELDSDDSEYKNR